MKRLLIVGRAAKVANYPNGNVVIDVEYPHYEALICDIGIDEFIRVFGTEEIIKKLDIVELKNLLGLYEEWEIGK